MKTHASHGLASLCLSLLAITNAASPFDSVSAPVSEQVAKAVEWVAQAKKSASLAGAEALKVQEMATKSVGSIGGVTAKVGMAKADLEQTMAMEKRIRKLRDVLWGRAKEAALQEVPKILKEIKAAANKKAEAAAKKKATVFEKAMKAKAKVESAKASKAYMDVMAGAGKRAAEYTKVWHKALQTSTSKLVKWQRLKSSCSSHVATWIWQSVSMVQQAGRMTKPTRSLGSCQCMLLRLVWQPSMPHLCTTPMLYLRHHLSSWLNMLHSCKA